MSIFRNIIASMQKRREIFDGFPNSIHLESEQQKRMVAFIWSLNSRSEWSVRMESTFM